MATTLSRIKSQIQKLQKQADAIQSGVIARVRKEIAKHDLTVEDLFGGGGIVGNGRTAKAKTTVAKKAGADKPAKFADDKGNTWHGIGKRPQWIHDVLAAGRKLEDFLVGRGAATEAPKSKPVKVANKVAKKT